MSSAVLIETLLTYRYIGLFFLAFFEGPILSLAVGFLIFLGYFAALPAYAVLFFGDLIPDTAYYFLGRYGERRELLVRWRKRSRLLHHGLPYLQKLWHDHGRKTMFWSKLAYGFATPFLISAGLVKLSLAKFWSYCVPVTLLQYAVFLTLGYYLGNSYARAADYISGTAAITALIGAVVLISLFVRRYICAEVEKLEGLQ